MDHGGIPHGNAELIADFILNARPENPYPLSDFTRDQRRAFSKAISLMKSNLLKGSELKYST